MSGTVGTLGSYDDAIFPGFRFAVRDDSPPVHAERCAAHGYYRGPHCPKCLLAFEEISLRDAVRRVVMQQDRCAQCDGRVPKGRTKFCSRACYRASSGRQG